MLYGIGIDIGGMSVKAGLVDESGRMVAKNKSATKSTPDSVIEEMAKQIHALLSEKGLSVKDIEGIGIGCPGAVTSGTGMVDFLPNLGWKNVPLVKKLKEYFDTEIIISNDANVAALGEAVYGCAKNYNTSSMFTLGPGVGGGILIDKKLYEGGHSKGAELGHVTLTVGGEPCTCGRRGCIEAYVSATALIKQTKKAMTEDIGSLMWSFVGGDIDAVDGRTAFECAKKGDKTALKVQNTYVMYLSESIMNMLNIFRPDVFIIGGGISAQGKYLTDLINDYCKKFDYGYKGAPAPDIVTATLGNDAGILGAAALLK